jgi:hypothetical protein
MNLPGFSVKRPIFTTMVTLILVILGAVSLSRLQIDMLPNIELPTLTHSNGLRWRQPRGDGAAGDPDRGRDRRHGSGRGGNNILIFGGPQHRSGQLRVGHGYRHRRNRCSGQN